MKKHIRESGSKKMPSEATPQRSAGFSVFDTRKRFEGSRLEMEAGPQGSTPSAGGKFRGLTVRRYLTVQKISVEKLVFQCFFLVTGHH